MYCSKAHIQKNCLMEKPYYRSLHCKWNPMVEEIIVYNKEGVHGSYWTRYEGSGLEKMAPFKTAIGEEADWCAN